MAKKQLFIFDVDGTLCESQREVPHFIVQRLRKLSQMKNVETAVVSGSNESKILRQFRLPDRKSLLVGSDYESSPLLSYLFFENGLVAYKMGLNNETIILHEGNILKHLGENQYQTLVNYALQKLSTIVLPCKRSNFIELRTANMNICPIGRTCTIEEREAFARFDAKAGVRENLRRDLESAFGESMGLEFASGGQLSIDCFPKGWNKSFVCGLIDRPKYDEVIFLGDKCDLGGNDYALYMDTRVTNAVPVTGMTQTAELIDYFIAHLNSKAVDSTTA